MSLALLLLACAPPRGALPGTSSCEDPAPAAGQARVCRLGAGDAPAGGSGRPTDWRLQNALLDVIVRAEYAPLTRLSGPGGTVVDAIPTGGGDPVLELIPSLPGGWFARLEITAVEEDDGAVALRLEGEGDDGLPRSLTYRLHPDTPRLALEGAQGFTLVPQVGAVAVGGTVESGLVEGREDETAEAIVLAAEGEVSDLGGELAWEGADAVIVAPRRAAYETRWPEGLAASGSADAHWVEARAGEALLARLPVAPDGSFSGGLPPEATALVATAEGRGEGPPVAPGEGLALSAGAEGWLRVRAVDEEGRDLPAVLRRGDREWFVPPGGAALPVGPGTAQTCLWAGPRFEAACDPALDVQGTVDWSAVLWSVGEGDAVLAELGVEVWPDAQVRAPAADLLARAVGRGVGYTVLIADDEVAQDAAVDPHVADALALRAGSRAGPDGGPGPLAWPFSADLERPAHGAVDWAALDAGGLLAALHQGGYRTVITDLSTAQAAVSAGDADQLARASALRLSSLDDLAGWFALLDAGHPLAAVGPWTWVEGPDPDAYAAVDVEAGLEAGATVASTGPRIRLAVDGQGPGSLVRPVTTSGEVQVSLRVESPLWAPVQAVTLHGPGGLELARWSPAPGPVPVEVSFDLVAPAWLVVVAWGQEESALTGQVPWAVSSPVWVEPVAPRG
ncbi:hypothetical protein L6R53_25545 [Myxococcota bacterium]|nr:hypothetical protein [Myxococcota bacterium]